VSKIFFSFEIWTEGHVSRIFWDKLTGEKGRELLDMLPAVVTANADELLARAVHKSTATFDAAAITWGMSVFNHLLRANATITTKGSYPEKRVAGTVPIVIKLMISFAEREMKIVRMETKIRINDLCHCVKC
jgi:hypothetical protein